MTDAEQIAAGLTEAQRSKLVEVAARALAIGDGHDPDETWEEFDRNAAATDMMWGGISDEEIFPKRVRWKEYEAQAQSVVRALLESRDRPQSNRESSDAE